MKKATTAIAISILGLSLAGCAGMPSGGRTPRSETISFYRVPGPLSRNFV